MPGWATEAIGIDATWKLEFVHNFGVASILKLHLYLSDISTRTIKGSNSDNDGD